LNEDSWQSWLISLILAFVIIKFVFFPVLSLITGSGLPLVVVESCSMYHGSNFDSWWQEKKLWYEDNDIEKGDFEEFPFNSGLNKGDIILIWDRGIVEEGDIIVFNANYRNPLIHRVVEFDGNYSTKGDHNPTQLDVEREINPNNLIGRAVLRVPALGWAKLIFFEGSRPAEQRGFCR